MDNSKFGFSSFAEQWNGRLAMMGFVIGLGTELLTGQGILHQIGLGWKYARTRRLGTRKEFWLLPTLFLWIFRCSSWGGGQQGWSLPLGISTGHEQLFLDIFSEGYLLVPQMALFKVVTPEGNCSGATPLDRLQKMPRTPFFFLQ